MMYVFLCQDSNKEFNQTLPIADLEKGSVASAATPKSHRWRVENFLLAAARIRIASSQASHHPVAGSR
jgi:hypothetical protein